MFIQRLVASRKRNRPARRRFGGRRNNQWAGEALECRSLLTSVTEFSIDVAEPFAPVTLGEEVFFVAEGNDGFSELWAISNGQIRFVYTMGDVGSPKLVVAGDNLFFPVASIHDGIELFRSDGTPEGTQMVRDIRPDVGSALHLAFWEDTVSLDDRIIFTANNGFSGFEVWTSDGTSSGTQLVKDIRPFGQSSSGPRFYSVTSAGVFFRANDGIHGTELWVTDGTEAGTDLVANFTPGAASSRLRFVDSDANGVVIQTDPLGLWYATSPDEFPVSLLADGPVLDAFTFQDDVYFQTRGSAPGTTQVYRTQTGQIETLHTQQYGANSQPGGFHGILNNRLIFSQGQAASTGDGWQGQNSLFATDGTSVELLHEFAFNDVYTGEYSFPVTPSQPEFTRFNDQWIYSGFNGSTWGLWKTDGTAAGTEFVTLAQSAATAPRDFVLAEEEVFFLNDDIVHVTDGTSDGTAQAHDTFFANSNLYESDAGALLPDGDSLFLFAPSAPDAPPAPEITTPQSQVRDGIVEWNAVSNISYYEVFRTSNGSTPPTDPGYEFEQTTGLSTTLPSGWGQRHVFVRSVREASGQITQSDWTRGVFINTPKPQVISPVHDGLAEQFDGFSNWELGYEFRFLADEFVQIQIFNMDDPETQVGGKAFIADSTRIIFPSVGSYEYRVRQHSSGSGIRYSDWTVRRRIHVVGDGTRLISPFSDQESNRPVFRWTEFRGSTYTLQVSNETTGENQLIFVEGITDLEYTPDFDLPAGDYRAWVRPNYRGNEQAWSEAISFSIGMEISGVMPTGSIETNMPLIEWDAVDGNVKYEVWMNQHNGQSGVVHATDLTTNSYQLTDALEDGLYRLWVRARFGNGQRTPWSEMVEFTVGEPVVPVITSPGGPVSQATEFTWTGPSSVTNWRLYIRDQNTLEDIIIPPGQITTTSYTFAESLPESRYVAWVQGYVNGSPATSWSPAMKFSVGPFPQLSGFPEVVTRLDEKIFSWTSVAGISRYELFVRHEQSSRYAFTETVVGESYNAISHRLPTGTYQAWVRGKRDDGTVTRWSEVFEFLVTDVQ